MTKGRHADVWNGLLTPSIPRSEVRRIRALRRYETENLTGLERLDELVELAAEICETPISVISLVESDRQIFLSRKGLDICGTPRDVSFCGHAIHSKELMVVADALEDPRFHDNPLVVGEPYVRFYAGAPLVCPDGQNIGTLCVVDHRPRTLTDAQRKSLGILARQVVMHLELRRALLDGRERLRKLQAAQRTTVEQDQLFLSAIRAMHDGFILQDRKGTIIQFNDRACEILGVSQSEMKRRRTTDSTWQCIDEKGDFLPASKLPVSIALETGDKQLGTRMGIFRKDDELVWIAVNAVPLFRGGSGVPYAVLSTFADITEERKREQRTGQYLSQLKDLANVLEIQRDELSLANIKLHRLADQDGLTGLENHRSLHRILEETLKQPGYTSLLLLDVDHFKQYNDSFGHPAGDALLQLLAQLMKSVVRPLDSVCRYGGEEFAIVVPGAAPEAAEMVALRLLSRVRRETWPFRDVTVSIGLATTACGLSKSRLIEAADKALYEAKNAGRDRHHVGTVGAPRKSA